MQLSSFSAVMQLLSTHTTRLYCHLFTRRACAIMKHEVTALIAKRGYAAVNYVEFLEFHQSAHNLVLWPDPSPLREFNLGVGSGNETSMRPWPRPLMLARRKPAGHGPRPLCLIFLCTYVRTEGINRGQSSNTWKQQQLDYIFF